MLGSVRQAGSVLLAEPLLVEPLAGAALLEREERPVHQLALLAVRRDVDAVARSFECGTDHLPTALAVACGVVEGHRATVGRRIDFLLLRAPAGILA